MTETLQPVDLLAVALALAALIGCINYLWVKLPPAIGMLLGSLVLSLIIVSSDRLFHLHAMTGLRAAIELGAFSPGVSQRRAGALAVRRQPARRHCGIEPAPRHDPAVGHRERADCHHDLRRRDVARLQRHRHGGAADLVRAARRHPGADRRGRGRDLAASGRAAAEPARGHRRREPVQRRRRRGAVPSGAGRYPGRDLPYWPRPDPDRDAARDRWRRRARLRRRLAGGGADAADRRRRAVASDLAGAGVRQLSHRQLARTVRPDRRGQRRALPGVAVAALRHDGPDATRAGRLLEAVRSAHEHHAVPIDRPGNPRPDHPAGRIDPGGVRGPARRDRASGQRRGADAVRARCPHRQGAQRRGADLGRDCAAAFRSRWLCRCRLRRGAANSWS